MHIDRQVAECGDQNGVAREARYAHGRTSADGLLADQNLPGQLLAVLVVLIEDREVFVVQHATATNRHQIRAVDVPFVNQVFFAIVDRLGQPMKLVPALAKYVRRGKELDNYFFVQPGKVDHEFVPGSVGHLLEPDINQEIYGLPEYLASLNATWLDNAATLFRRRYYKNGSHAGFILYLSDPAHNEADIEALQEALANSRGPGNFRNLLMYLPNGKPDSVKVIPIGEVAAKDNFADIKSVSRSDQQAAHRVPPALMGTEPNNAGGFGDPIKAAQVFNCNEIEPLQERFKELNDWLGIEIIRFKPYRLAAEEQA